MPNVNIPKISLPDLKLPDLKLPDIDIAELGAEVIKAARDIATVAKDTAYVVIGAGVLGYQRAQVQRQELRKRLSDPKAGLDGAVSTVRTDVLSALHNVDSTVESLVERFEEIIERMEAALAPLEERLPNHARELAKQAHVQAKEARSQLKTMIPKSAA